MDTYVKILGIISILTLLMFIPLAVINGTYGWIPDVIIFVGLALFYLWTYSLFNMNMPIYTLLIIGHILHLCGIFGWYHISPVPIQWDHITHFFGAMPFALLFFNWIKQWMDYKLFTKKNLLLLALIFLAATGVGAVVEISEFLGYLSFGFGEGAFMFGPGDGVAGLEGMELIDAIGGGWINEGWDFIFNTLGILTGMTIMLITWLFARKPRPAYYFNRPQDHSTRIS